MSLPARTLLTALVLVAAPLAPVAAMDVEAYVAEARELLTSYLTSDDPEIAARALEVLGVSCDAAWGSMAILDSGALDSSSDLVINRALLALGQLGDPGSAVAVAAKSGGDAYIAMAAAEGLALIVSANPDAGADVVDAAVELASHEADIVRIIACTVLAYLPDHAGTAKLVELLQGDSSNAVRRAAASALTLHGDVAEVGDAMVALADASSLADLDVEVAEMAVLALGNVRGDKRDPALVNAMGAISHSSLQVREAAIWAVSLLATPENAGDHQDPLSARIGSVAGTASQAELQLLEALELRLALLTAEFGNIDRTKYPQYFFDERGAKAVVDMEQKLVYEGEVAASGGTPAQQAAARGAADALLALDRRAIRARMEASLFDANNDARGALIDAAIATEAAKGSGDPKRVLERLQSRAEDLQVQADESRADMQGATDKRLDSLYVRWSENEHAWQWVTRIEAAGDFLKIVNGR